MEFTNKAQGDDLRAHRTNSDSAKMRQANCCAFEPHGSKAPSVNPQGSVSALVVIEVFGPVDVQGGRAS